MNSYEFLLKGKENHHKFTKEANFEAMKNLDLASQQIKTMLRHMLGKLV